MLPCNSCVSFACALAKLRFAVLSAVCASLGSISASTSPCFTCWPSATSTFVTRPAVEKLRLLDCCAATTPLVLTLFVMLPVDTFAVCVCAVADGVPRMKSHQTPNATAAIVAASATIRTMRPRHALLPPASRSS